MVKGGSQITVQNDIYHIQTCNFPYQINKTCFYYMTQATYGRKAARFLPRAQCTVTIIYSWTFYENDGNDITYLAQHIIERNEENKENTSIIIYDLIILIVKHIQDRQICSLINKY